MDFKDAGATLKWTDIDSGRLYALEMDRAFPAILATVFEGLEIRRTKAGHLVAGAHKLLGPILTLDAIHEWLLEHFGVNIFFDKNQVQPPLPSLVDRAIAIVADGKGRLEPTTALVGLTVWIDNQKYLLRGARPGGGELKAMHTLKDTKQGVVRLVDFRSASAQQDGDLEQNRCDFLLMEYLPGFVRLSDTPRLDLLEVSHLICANLKQAVTAIHNLDMAHGDLHSANVMVHPKTGEVKLAMFAKVKFKDKKAQECDMNNMIQIARSLFVFPINDAGRGELKVRPIGDPHAVFAPEQLRLRQRIGACGVLCAFDDAVARGYPDLAWGYLTHPVYLFYTSKRSFCLNLYRVYGMCETKDGEKRATVLAAHLGLNFKTTMPLDDLVPLRQWSEAQLTWLQSGMAPDSWVFLDPLGFHLLLE